MATQTITVYPNDFEALNASGTALNITNKNNCIGTTNGNPSGSSYAQVYLVTGSNAHTYGWWSFDLSSIPVGSIITNISGRAKVYSGGNSQQVVSRKLYVYIDRGTQIGEGTIGSSSTSVFNITYSSTTCKNSEVYKIEYCIDVARGTKQTSSNYYIRPYGASLTVTYIEPQLYVKSGTWREVSSIYEKQNGVWGQQTPLHISNTNPDNILKG